MEREVSESSDDRSTVRASDALLHESGSSSLQQGLHRAELWLFVDAHRWAVIGLLSLSVFAAVALGVILSPPSVMAYLAEGTAIAKGYS